MQGPGKQGVIFLGNVYNACLLWVGLVSMEDQEFVQQSTEVELVQLFRVYDELCEQRQELENKLDEAEDTQLP